MQVYERKIGVAGTISVSVSADQIARMNSAMQYISRLNPAIQMSRLMVELLLAEAARQGWNPADVEQEQSNGAHA
jgi:hypothetical protein